MAAADDDALIGELVDGRYRIEELIGRGGMGRVYRAENVSIHRQVALKLFSSGVGDALADRQRFQREAFASGRVIHPNCVAVSDFGMLDDGTLFLAMELLDGVTLGEVIELERHLPVERALHITKHILRGLGHAHEQGIVHRDLKPQNVILIDHLDDHDFAKVLDFGLAKLIGNALIEEGGGKLTQAGVTFGTPSYIAPEQALGKSVDNRADLYATAVILFEMLAGAPPFASDDPRELLMMHVNRSPPRIGDVGDAVFVPTDIELLVRRGMAKDPGDRMVSADAFIADIDRWLESLPAPGRSPTPLPFAGPSTLPTSDLRPPSAPPSAPAPAPAPAGQRRHALIASGVVAALAVVAIVIVLVSGDGEGAATQAAPLPVATVADAAPPLAPGAVVESLSVAAAARAAISSSDSEGAERAIKALQKAHPDNAELAFLLGTVYYARPFPPEAIKAYRRAIELDPAYRDNATIITNAIDMLRSRSARRQASLLLSRDIGAAAIPLLEQAVASHDNHRIRERAKVVLRQLEKSP